MHAHQRSAGPGAGPRAEQEAGARQVGTGRPPPPLSASAVHGLQGLAGNAAVAALIRPATGVVQRACDCGGSCGCGPEQEGSSPDDGIPASVQRVDPPTAPPPTAPAKPSPTLPAGSKWHAIAEKPLLAKLGEALVKNTFSDFQAKTPSGSPPADLGEAIELLTSAQINAAIQVYRKLAAFDLWKETGDITSIDSQGALRIIFTSVGTTQARVEGATPGTPLHDQFCKDATYGASYHKGGLAWREIVPGEVMGLHIVPLDHEFHIDPHQPVTGKTELPDYEPGPVVHLPIGQGKGVPFMLPKPKSAFLAKRCAYDLFGDVSHMSEVASGAPINVFTRREADYGRLARSGAAVAAVKEPAAQAALTAKLAPLRGRLDALGPVLEGWAARGLQEGEGLAAAQPVFAELAAIEKVLSEVEWDLMTPEQRQQQQSRERLAAIAGGVLGGLKAVSDLTGVTPIGVVSKGSKTIVDFINSF